MSLTVLVAAAALVGGTAAADSGPVTVSIPSVGVGFQMCINNIPVADSQHQFRAVSGTRHPFRAALYRNDDSLLGLSAQLGNDIWYTWDEATQFPGQNGRRVRIDNQATASGNGNYSCRTFAV